MMILPLFAAPANTIIRPLDNPRIDEFVENLRSTFGTKIIGRKTSVREKAAQVLQKGEKIIIIPDVNWQERGSVFVDFFGIQASTAIGLAKMTLETDAVILPAFLIWQEDKQRYLLEFDEAIEFEKTADEEENIREITQKATATIEKYVRLFPEQWLWIHKRWNTRPKGETLIY